MTVVVTAYVAELGYIQLVVISSVLINLFLQM